MKKFEEHLQQDEKRASLLNFVWNFTILGRKSNNRIHEENCMNIILGPKWIQVVATISSWAEHSNPRNLHARKCLRCLIPVGYLGCMCNQTVKCQWTAEKYFLLGTEVKGFQETSKAMHQMTLFSDKCLRIMHHKASPYTTIYMATSLPITTKPVPRRGLC